MWMAIAASSCKSDSQAALVSLAAAITPTMTWHHGDTLLLDVKGSLQWLGGIRGLRRRVQTELKNLEMRARLAFAPSATGAWLLVTESNPGANHNRWRYALSLKRLAKQLDPIAVERLPSAQPHSVWLQQLGCYQLRHLRTLERTELAARTSPALLIEMDQAYGRTAFIYQPLVLPIQFNQRLTLTHLAKRSTAIEPYLKRLLQSLCQWLRQKHMAITHLECRLHHRDRRRAWQPTVLNLAIGKPTDEFSVLWRWLSVRLQSTTLPAGVSDIGLVSRTLTERCEHNLALFADDHNQQSDACEALDLLRARLGAARVRQTTPKADYRAELANHWSASQSPSEPTSLPLAWGPHCPAWLLQRPKALSIHRDQPHLQGPLRLLQGPYRIETGWWDQGWVLRDYFVATDSSTRRYWIYSERDGINARWFLHGLFG